jgi:hypothetical protein
MRRRARPRDFKEPRAGAPSFPLGLRERPTIGAGSTPGVRSLYESAISAFGASETPATSNRFRAVCQWLAKGNASVERSPLVARAVTRPNSRSVIKMARGNARMSRTKAFAMAIGRSRGLLGTGHRRPYEAPKGPPERNGLQAVAVGASVTEPPIPDNYECRDH